MTKYKAKLTNPSTGETFEDEWNPWDDYRDIEWSNMLDYEQDEAARNHFDGLYPELVLDSVRY